MSDRALRIGVGLSLALHVLAAVGLSGPRFATPILRPPAQAPAVRVRLSGPPEISTPIAADRPPVAAAPPSARPESPIPKKPATRPEETSPRPTTRPVPEPVAPEPESIVAEPARQNLAAVDPEVSPRAARPAGGRPGEADSAHLPSDRASAEEEANRLARYVEAVRARIEARKRYPSMARKRAVEGRVVARVAIRADGELTGIEFDGAAPALLRRATDDAIRAASPYPAPPAGPLTIELPVDYSLRDAS
jgi:protein TonB